MFTIEANVQIQTSKADDILASLAVLTRDLRDVLFQLTSLNGKVDRMAGELDALRREVEENNTVMQSAATLLGNLAQQIRDMAEDPAALRALADEMDANTSQLAAAVTANTPPAEPPAQG